MKHITDLFFMPKAVSLKRALLKQARQIAGGSYRQASVDC